MRIARRQMTAVLSILACMLCLPSLAEDRAGAGPGEPGAVVPLVVSRLTPGAGQTAVLPPPGEYEIPKDDMVLLHAHGDSPGGGGPIWSGDAAGTAGTLSLQMDGAKHVAVSLDGAAPPPSEQPPVFDAPEKGALHTFLGSGKLHGWFSVDRSRPGIGAGITHLVAADSPCFPIFARPNLNFEHIVNGAAADMHRSLDTPRTDPMQVRVLSPASVEVCWPAAASAWNIDCRMRYTFTGDNAIDMEFEATPRSEEAPKGWLLFMWASYMQMVRARTIYFLGTDGGAEKWMSFGGTGRSGTVAGMDQPDLPQDDGYQRFNAETDTHVRFTQPFYYGLRDTDMDPGTTDDTMACIMMFDDAMATRFAVWNWGDDPTVSAWDWQYVIRNPEVGRTYRHRARLVCKRFAGEDDVLAEYTLWRDGRAATGSLPLAPASVLLAPGISPFSHGAIMDRAAAENPGLTLEMCRGMLSSALYGKDAARRMDTILEGRWGSEALRDQWEWVTAAYPTNPVAWHHLGLAREKAGDLDGAVAAYMACLAVDSGTAAARLRLGVLCAKAGDRDAGLALAEEAVCDDAALGAGAAEVYSHAAEALLSERNPKGALPFLRRAASLSPGDLHHRAALGTVLETLGDDAGALAEYRAVVEEAPESPRASDRIDAILDRRGDPAARVREWRRLVQLHPDATVPQLHLDMARKKPKDAPQLSILSSVNVPKELVLSPPQGEYCIPYGDSVVVRADVPSAPEKLAGWTGDGEGLGRARTVFMDGPKRLEVMLSDRQTIFASVAPEVFSVPKQGALHAFLGSGGLYGWFSASRQKENTGAGITQLACVEEPFCPVFKRPNLNFEHIMNGCRDDIGRSANTPRTDPMEVRFLSPHSAEVFWPSQRSSWKLDCAMRYTFAGKDAVDMEFEVTPRADEAPRGFLLFMWASYMHAVRGRTIHFPGVRGDRAGWVAFGTDGENGTVSGEGQAPLQYDSEAGAMNLNTAAGVRFREPVYYGLVDGDQNMMTAGDTMAYIMMFDAPEATRFAVWNWGDSPYCSAWDWQFLVPNPEVGHTYRHHARMVFKRFSGEADVLDEYHRWRDARARAVEEAPLPLDAFPVLLSPGQERQNPVQLGDRIAAEDPDRALELYREALRRDMLRPAAAERIRDLLGKRDRKSTRLNSSH